MSRIKAEDRVGKIYGDLEALDCKRENGRAYLYCKCLLCGDKKWILAQWAAKGRGCNCERPHPKALDIAGKMSGRLTAVRNSGKRNRQNEIMWECECECGNTCLVSTNDFLSKGVRSCGCLRTEFRSQNGKAVMRAILDKNQKEGTRLDMISSKKPLHGNKSGVRGVRWDAARQKWYAGLILRGKTYYLGRYDNLEDAKKARERAEEELYGPILEKYGVKPGEPEE